MSQDTAAGTSRQGPFAGLVPKAIVLGVIVDHIATIIFGIALVTVLSSEDMFSSDEKVSEAAMSALGQSPDYLLSTLVGGLICTILGSFIGARSAAVNHLRHGVWIAVASSALILVFLPFGGVGSQPFWFDAVGGVLLLPAGLFGGALAQWTEMLHKEAESNDI